MKTLSRIDFSDTINRLKSTPRTEVLSERAELIGMFLEKLNSERGDYKPLTAKRVAIMLSGIKSVKDLRAFYGECSQASHFSRYYFYCFKKAKEL